mmetsp:Transcript_6811/g.13293  ORF Transcript_6811/g.13293 Transcript_6811/m.13293 type:complete len:82 (-) Transcript_6811:1194-1439(-)
MALAQHHRQGPGPDPIQSIQSNESNRFESNRSKIESNESNQITFSINRTRRIIAWRTCRPTIGTTYMYSRVIHDMACHSGM